MLEPPLFTHWVQFLHWLLNTTMKFPKRVRFTLSQRIDNLALDTLEDLIEARYSQNKKLLLQRMNLRLEKLRILLRICHEEQCLSTSSYEYASRELHKIGTMVGGWIKQQG